MSLRTVHASVHMKRWDVGKSLWNCHLDLFWIAQGVWHYGLERGVCFVLALIFWEAMLMEMRPTVASRKESDLGCSAWECSMLNGCFRVGGLVSKVRNMIERFQFWVCFENWLQDELTHHLILWRMLLPFYIFTWWILRLYHICGII